MKHFAVLLRMKSEELTRKYRPDHTAYLERGRAEGFVFANGRFMDGTGGLVIYKGESIEEVEARVKKDPFVIHGAREYEIHEWEMIT